MAYSAPTISAGGLSVPNYSDIQTKLNTAFQSIFGSTVYLAASQPDYQWISAVALALSDMMGGIQLAYNSRSPLTAIGAALDEVVKMNGLARLVPTPSTAVLTLSGTPGTVVNGGVVEDVNGIYWALPATVTIGIGGTVSVSATCQTLGPISAQPGTITQPIQGLTAGWTSVTNAGPAVVGTSVEADSNLRARQSVSVALPSSTRLAGTIAGIEATLGVTRNNCLENQTGATDAYGNLGHSLTCVVEGGTDLAVATSIYSNRGLGCNTQGATVPTMTIVNVTDPQTGQVTPIGFVRPTYVPIFVGILIHGLTSAFTTATQARIKAALVAYLNSLQIGEVVTLSALYGVALSAMTNLSLPTYSVRSLTLGTTASAAFTAGVASGGTGYTVGDIVTVVQSGASGGQFTVTSIGGSGAVTGVSAVAAAGGTGYSVASGLATTGGTGTGLAVNLTAVAPTGTSDQTLDFYQVAEGLAANVALAVV